MESWTRVIVEWVNCLGIAQTSVEDLQDLRNGVFYEKLIAQLSSGNEENATFASPKTTTKTGIDERELVSKFIRAEYPEFTTSVDEPVAGIPEELYTASLLLTQCSQKTVYHRPMCSNLRHETQIEIKKFLELVLPYGKSLTREVIGAAITELGDATPRSPPSTPKPSRPLREFFNSPAARSAQSQRHANDRNRELRRLRAQLETERFEKTDLVEDIRIQEEKICNLQKKLDIKSRELRSLRNERPAPSPAHTRDEEKRPSDAEERYRRELEQTENVNAALQSEIDRLEADREELSRRLTSRDRMHAALREKLDLSERSTEALSIQLKIKSNELLDMRMNNEELRAHIREIQLSSIGDRSFEMETAIGGSRSPVPLNSSEALSAIVDIQLQEAKEETAQLTNRLAATNERFERLSRDFEESKRLNDFLREKTVEFESVKLSMRDAEERVLSSRARATSLETENSELREKFDKVVAEMESKEELLRSARKLREASESELAVADSKIRDLEIGREIDKSRFIELEKMFAAAKEECEDLKNLLSSSEERFSGVSDEKKILESKLRDGSRKIEQSEASLIDERSKVAELSTSLERAHRESVELKNLLKSIEDKLSLAIEDKETLQLILQESTKKLESSEVSLTNERSKVTNLESIVESTSELSSKLEDLLRSREEQLTDLTDKKKSLELDLRKIEEKFDRSKVSLNSERSRVEDLRSIVAGREEESASLRALLGSREDELSSLTKNKKVLEDDLQDVRKNLENSETSLRNERVRVTELKATIANAERESEKMKNLLALNADRLSEVTGTKIALQSDLDRTIEKLEISESRSRNETLRVVELESAFSQALRESEGLEEALRTGEALLARERTRIAELESKFALGERDAEELRVTLKEVKRALDSERSASSELREIVSRSRATSEKLESLLRSKEDLLESYLLESESSGRRVKELESLLSSESSRSADLETKFFQTRESLESSEAALASSRSLLVDVEDSKKILEAEFQLAEAKILESEEKIDKLEEKLSRLEDEKTEILLARASIEDQSRRAKEKNVTLESKICEYERRIDGLEKDLEEAEKNLQEENSANAQLRKNESELEKRKIELEDKLSQERNQSAINLSERIALEKELSSRVQSAASAEEQIGKLKKELEEAEKNLQEQNSANAQLRKNESELEKRKIELEDKLSQERNQSAINLSERIALEKELSSRVQSAASAEEQIGKLKKELEEAEKNLQEQNSANAQLRKNESELEKRKIELEDKLTQERNQSAINLSERIALEKELSSRVQSAASAEEQIGKLKKELEEAEKNLQEQNCANAQLRKNESELEKRKIELEDKLSQERNQSAINLSERIALEKELSSRVQSAASAEEQIGKLKKELEEAEKNLQEQNSANAQLRKNESELEKRKIELEDKLTQERNQSAISLSERNSLEKELSSRVQSASIMKERIEKIEKQLEKSRENMHEQLSAKAELEKDKIALNELRSILENDLEHERRESSSARSKKDALEEELSSRVNSSAKLTERLSKVEKDLEESEKKLNSQLAVNALLSEEKRLQEEHERNVKEELSEYRDKLSSIRSEKEMLEEEASLYARSNEDLAAGIVALKAECEEQREDLRREREVVAASEKIHRDSRSSMEKLEKDLAEERDRSALLRTERIDLENELRRLRVFESRDARRTRDLESAEKECASLRERIAELSEVSDRREKEVGSAIERFQEAELEKNRWRNNFEEGAKSSDELVASLEERLIVLDKDLAEARLEERSRREDLTVQREKHEVIAREKDESELKMKEVIANLQELRASQDGVLKAQAKALEEKTLDLREAEKQLVDSRNTLEAKIGEIEGARSKTRQAEVESEKLRESLDRQSKLVEESRNDVEELTRRCEDSENNFEDIARVAMSSKLEFRELWDGVSQACPELAGQREEKYDSENILESGMTKDFVESFAEEARIIRGAVSTLIEANETLKGRLDAEKKTSKNNASEAERTKIELEERIKKVEGELEKRDRCLTSLAREEKDLQVLLSKAVSVRDEVDQELGRLTDRWRRVAEEARSVLTSGSSACDELKHLRIELSEIDEIISDSNDRQARGSRPLLEAVHRIFVWSESKLREERICSVGKEDSSARCELSGEREILRTDVGDSERVREELGKAKEKMERFSSLLRSYETSLRAGTIKREATNEEKLQAEVEKISRERRDTKEKLDAVRARNAKLEKNMDEIRNENKKLKSEASTKKTTDLEEIERLERLTGKLETEIAGLRKDNEEMSRNEESRARRDEERLKEVHSEYGLKLEKIKQKMKTAYNEQIAKLNQEQEKAMKDKIEALRGQMEQQCRKYTEDIAKYKAHISDLSSRYWDVGEKLLAETQEKQAAIQQLQQLKGHQQGSIVETNQQITAAQSHQKTASLDRRDFGADRGARESTARPGYRAVEVIEEETTTYSTRRHSVKSIQAMGNAFKAEDEEGEVFDSVYLADLKEGRCAPVGPDFERLSELRIRNSMCRPHLRSSYAVETHVQPISLNEDDIKNGVTGDDVFNDSLSQSLLPGQKPKKKDRTQTSYKRPGPPTPSKNGGRLSLQGNELKSPGSRVLRERNVERRTTATPRGLKNLFGNSISKRQDENVAGTPKGRRLSNIFRKQRTDRN